MKMEGAFPSERRKLYKSTRRHIPDSQNFHQHLRSRIGFLITYISFDGQIMMARVEGVILKFPVNERNY